MSEEIIKGTEGRTELLSELLAELKTMVISNEHCRDRDVRAGEMIMSAPALVTGPKLQPPVPLCVGCHCVTRGPGELTSCPRCGLLLCRKECGDTELHQQECGLIR